MGDGDDSFAETVFNFFEILAASADESDPSYPSVVSLLNGYMPLMIDLVRSDRGTFPLSFLFLFLTSRLLRPSTWRRFGRIRPLRRRVRRDLRRSLADFPGHRGLLQPRHQENVLHGRSNQHLHRNSFLLF